MIKVGFIGAVSKEWMGGLNYYKNLLFALNSLENKELEIFVFVGKNTDSEIKIMFKQYATVIEDSMFDRKSFKWFITKLEKKIFQTNLLLEMLLKKYNIQILSHASITNLRKIKTINWIPDFQHLHLPQMFSDKDLKTRNEGIIKVIKQSDVVILSSNNALNDLRNFTPEYFKKAKVLQFVSQPEKKYFNLNEDVKQKILKKYNILSDFYYIPNQLWKHKNHFLVFEVINELKKDNIEVNVICSGYLDDFRNKMHVKEINDFIRINNLENNIKLLGLIDYEDVFSLMKFSKAVINPSLFEGWSSTVEECKSVGKNMILSDLDVHKEQYPQATFFKRDDINDLKNILKNYNNANSNNNMDKINERTKEFGEKYIAIVKELML